MSIVVVGGQKGGCGKTTIATNLTVMLAASGLDVLLIDADDQETSIDFTAKRAERMQKADGTPGDTGYTCISLTGMAVKTELPKLAPKYDHIIVDAGGRDTTSQRAALGFCDVFLLPVEPTSYQVWTFPTVNTWIEDVKVLNPKMRAYAFVNKAYPSGTENADTEEQIRECPGLELLPVKVRTRKAYHHAGSVGMAVSEWRPKDADAVDDIGTLFGCLFNIQKIKNIKRA